MQIEGPTWESYRTDVGADPASVDVFGSLLCRCVSAVALSFGTEGIWEALNTKLDQDPLLPSTKTYRCPHQGIDTV